jgi:D-serine deaminase-like pyridoxal phosphate-dependent protein
MSEVGLTLNEIETPFLWVDLDRLDDNIRLLSEDFREAGVAWRPHIKGIRVPAVARRMLEAGAIGVTCATVGEAEVMADAGVADLLIAHQVVGPRKYARVAALRRRAGVKVAVDSEATLAGLGEAALTAGVELGVLLEVDTGMRRAGVQPGEPALALAQRVRETSGLIFMGVMGWEGHTPDIEDLREKRFEIEQAVGLLVGTAKLLRANGCPVDIVSCGGTGTVTVTPRIPGVTEIQAGGAVFSDVIYRKWGALTQPALFLRSTVTSRPVPHRIICDAGFKTLPTWTEAPEALGITGVHEYGKSAEHGVLRLSVPDHRTKVGDPIDFIPAYGDSTVFLHDRLYGVRGGRVEAVWVIEGRSRMR